MYNTCMYVHWHITAWMVQCLSPPQQPPNHNPALGVLKVNLRSFVLHAHHHPRVLCSFPAFLLHREQSHVEVSVIGSGLLGDERTNSMPACSLSQCIYLISLYKIWERSDEVECPNRTMDLCQAWASVRSWSPPTHSELCDWDGAFVVIISTDSFSNLSILYLLIGKLASPLSW